MTLLTSGDSRAQTDDYVSFCDGLRTIAKVDLLQYKRGQMERRVRTFAERRGHPALGSYLTELRRSSAEVDAFLDRVTINVSQLWRNPEQWTILADHVLPELAAARSARVRSWSAGCSYGAEAYTLGALCHATIGGRAEIHGTDIDRRMVDRARVGRFTAEDGRAAPRRELSRWFDPEPDGGWLAKRELRSMMRFEVGDLLRMRPQREAFDLILCRNTVIYFNEGVRDDLHARLVAALRPGGYLVTGATERVVHARELGLELTHPFTYRKTAA
jgi:chemotaxis protein methyltransferase CheR